MVSDTGEKNGAGAIRALNAPKPVEVRESKENRPSAIKVEGIWQGITTVQDIWRIDDEWWRSEQISRIYFTVSLKDGTTPTIFRDLVTKSWYQQSR